MCNCTLVKLALGPDGLPLATPAMAEELLAQFQQAFAGDRRPPERILPPEQALIILQAVLGVAPRLKVERRELLEQAGAWMKKLAEPSGPPGSGALSERARHQEAMAGAVSEFLTAALAQEA